MSDFEEVEKKASSTDNQYLLALAMAKRVRTLRSGAPPLVDGTAGRANPVRTTMAEFAREKVRYDMKDDAVEEETDTD